MNQMLKGQCALQIGQSSCYFAMQIWLRGRLDEWNGWERKWIVPKQMRSQDQNLYTAQMENDAAMTCYCIPKTCNETVFFTWRLLSSIPHALKSALRTMLGFSTVVFFCHSWLCLLFS
jgi:hypothetical protein